ncbi:hypothetical protein K435DRAFT_870635 [Dendrothele bispora CBS 962.96]|uniref:Uncharacterized protein n=1 Tax=Dendrothele bispora (strain CBS 962.96) TaxID=1314807 RepID=A0A4S8L636_DENBC|nr:hypothetical protein K435DRAFT_870635 [Dendrothele bispora CBS 962.96]
MYPFAGSVNRGPGTEDKELEVGWLIPADYTGFDVNVSSVVVGGFFDSVSTERELPLYSGSAASVTPITDNEVNWTTASVLWDRRYQVLPGRSEASDPNRPHQTTAVELVIKVLTNKTTSVTDRDKIPPVSRPRNFLLDSLNSAE